MNRKWDREFRVLIWVSVVVGMILILIDVWSDDPVWHKIYVTWMILTLPVTMTGLIMFGFGRRQR